MSDTKYDISVRKKALSGEYVEKVRKREEKIKESLSKAQFDFSKR